MTPSVLDPLAVRNSFFARHGRLIFGLAATVLLAISAVLHFWKLGSAPPGFSVDESWVAYNAYSIGETGADEFGVRFPLYSLALGQYTEPVFIYSLVPLVKLFGLEPWVARLPSALFLIGASLAFALLVQWYCQSRWLSLLAGFCFSVLPWVFPDSRCASTPRTIMVFGMTWGLLLLQMALEKESRRYAVAAGLAWAFAMYAYSVGRPMSVLILTCFCIAHASLIRTHWKVGLAFIVSWAAMLTPMAVAVARAPEIVTARFQAIGIFQDHPPWEVAINRIGSRFLEYFSPEFLFFRGDNILQHHTGFGGELFRFLIPMVLAGLYCLVRSWRKRSDYRFIGLALFVYPAAAVLTENYMHSGRSIHGAIFWGLTAVIGAHFLWQRRGTGRNVLLIACCVGIVEVGLYLRDFFGPFQERYRVGLYTGYTEALEDCFRVIGKDETVYISGAPSALSKPGYVYILFFGKIDPRVYQQQGIPKERVRLYDGTIPRPGILLRASMRRGQLTYNFNLPGAATAPQPVVLETNPEPIPPHAELLQTVPVGNLFQYEVYRVK